MRIVNSETFVPIGLAVAVIGGAATWVNGVNAGMQNQANQLEILAKNQEAHVKLNLEINARLSRIEWKIEESGYRRK